MRAPAELLDEVGNDSPIAWAEPGCHFGLQTVFWNTLGPGSVAYTVTELLDNMPASSIDRSLWVLGESRDYPRAYHRPAFPKLVYRAFCKAGVSASTQGRIARRRVLNAIRPGDVLYMWPPYDAGLMKGAQDRGAIVVAERINCMGQMGRDVLKRAYARRGLALPEGWFDASSIANEREEMFLCDFMTAPNECVADSLRLAGIPEGRILQTSYGFSPKRLASAIGIQRPPRRPVFAFVGLGIVRKGIDVLLEAWERANVDGKLLIAGHMDEELRRLYARVLERDDVEELGYVGDITRVYASADVFVFPSHEEGGPQVTYEAAACKLPCIVSPMGAGRVVRDQVEGVVVDPCSVDGLAAAITRLAEDVHYRHYLAVNAEARASEFTWSKVAAQRLRQLCDVVRSR